MSSSSISEDHLSLLLSAFPDLTPDDASNLVAIQNTLHNNSRTKNCNKRKQKESEQSEAIVSQYEVGNILFIVIQIVNLVVSAQNNSDCHK